MHTIAVMILIGMEHAITSVGRKLPRNTSNTKIASAAPDSIFSITESTTISM